MRLFKARKSGDIHSLPAATVIAIDGDCSKNVNTISPTTTFIEPRQFDQSTNNVTTIHLNATNGDRAPPLNDISSSDRNHNKCSVNTTMRTAGGIVHMAAHHGNNNNHNPQNPNVMNGITSSSTHYGGGSTVAGNLAVLAKHHHQFASHRQRQTNDTSHEPPAVVHQHQPPPHHQPQPHNNVNQLHQPQVNHRAPHHQPQRLSSQHQSRHFGGVAGTFNYVGSQHGTTCAPLIGHNGKRFFYFFERFWVVY